MQPALLRAPLPTLLGSCQLLERLASSVSASPSGSGALWQQRRELSGAASGSPGQQALSPRNIWCIGRNYAEHARELGNEVPTEPMIFLKAGTSAVPPGGDLPLPSWSQDVHHEVSV